MSFNYRVVRRILGGEYYYEVLEIYYKNNIPVSHGMSYNLLNGDTLSELKDTFNLIEKAFSLPTLKWNEQEQKFIEI